MSVLDWIIQLSGVVLILSFITCTYQCLLCYLPYSQLEGVSEVSWSERTALSREPLCRALLHVIRCVCQHARRPEDWHTTDVSACNMCLVSFLRGRIWQRVRQCCDFVVFLFKVSERWTGVSDFYLEQMQEHAMLCIHTQISGNPMSHLCFFVLYWGFCWSAPHGLQIWQLYPQNFN